MTGLEPIVADAAIKSLATIVVKTCWDGGGKLLGLFGNPVEKTQQLVFDAMGKYVKNYTKRHGILKVLGMRESVALESIYTGVQFLGEQDICRFESIDTLEEAYHEAKWRSYEAKDHPKQDALKIANQKQYLMVLGGPGAGKSTFLRRMGLEALKGNKGGFKHGCIPVFIELKRFNADEINIEKVIADEFRICGFPSPEESTKKLLDQGKLLILLDGLDEVPTKNMNEAIGKIQNFVDQYDKNRFIASCRTAAYRSSFRRFSDVAMAAFDDAQIQQFINNRFQSEEDKNAGTAQKCWEVLQKPENKAAKELAHTPLLLASLCLVYDRRSQNFPDKRSDLYRKALRILLEEWAVEKLILQDEIYQGLHTELQEILLSEIAYKGFEADRLFFDQREIVEQIKTFLASNLNAPPHVDGKAVLNAIAVHQGILVERAEYIFSFSHLTLQEYLTAQYIDYHSQVEKLVTEHLSDKRWKEVFLLVAELMGGGADELLLLMEKEAQKYINTPKLKALLTWAEQATDGSQGNFKPVGKRAAAIANAYAYAKALANAHTCAIANVFVNAYAYTIAITYANAIANAYAIDSSNILDIAQANAKALANRMAIVYAHEVEGLKIFKNVNFVTLIDRLEALKARITDIKDPLKEEHEIADLFREMWFKAFNISRQLVYLSEQEAEDLGNYLYANLLMVQCKQAAVGVSQEAWEEIEERMLRVPNK